MPTATILVYGLLTLIVVAGLTPGRALGPWRPLMLLAALALAITGFFIVGLVDGLMAWAAYGLATGLVILLRDATRRGTDIPRAHPVAAILVPLVLWPLLFAYVLWPPPGETPVMAIGEPADSAPDFPMDFETDGVKRPDTGVFADVLGVSLEAECNGEAVTIEVHDLGGLQLPTGEVVVCDGLILDEEPLETTVPPGEYPVLVAVARLSNGDERVAFARVQFSQRPVISWRPASEGGYGVDSGLGAFAAPQVLMPLQMAVAGHTDYIIHRMEETSRTTWSWLRVRAAGASAVIFSSGWGDGGYASYFGYDEQGEVAALLTSFDVIRWSP